MKTGGHVAKVCVAAASYAEQSEGTVELHKKEEQKKEHQKRAVLAACILGTGRRCRCEVWP